MIPRAFVTAWRVKAPWPADAQVEQDLVLSRALVAIYADPSLGQSLAFRGGTALHKLCIDPPGRYSEDLDFVQIQPGPIGPILDSIRAVLDPWLGAATSAVGVGGAKLNYRFETTSLPVQRMRVKIEINTREHFAVLGHRETAFAVENPWHTSSASITTFAVEELLATKLRALYQRRKGRDLYDLWLALSSLSPDPNIVVDCLGQYLEASGSSISRADFEANLAEKLANAGFRSDIGPLLRDPVGYDVDVAALLVSEHLISALP